MIDSVSLETSDFVPLAPYGVGGLFVCRRRALHRVDPSEGVRRHPHGPKFFNYDEVIVSTPAAVLNFNLSSEASYQIIPSVAPSESVMCSTVCML